MIKVNYRALGMLSTNCYVVENPDSQKVLIVDPGDSPLEMNARSTRSTATRRPFC